MTNEPTTPPPPPPGASEPPHSSSSSKGLVGRVFDLSFSEFITPSIIKIIFVLGVIISGLTALFVFIAFAQSGGAAVVVGLIVAPLIFAVYTLFMRVLCEVYIVLFKIEENTRELRK